MAITLHHCNYWGDLINHGTEIIDKKSATSEAFNITKHFAGTSKFYHLNYT